jgi:hypothetical protein
VNFRSGETRKVTPGCFWRVVQTAVCCAAALPTFSTAFAQVGGGASLQQIAGRFPDAKRVMADYSDDASRYAALSALLNDLPHGRETYEKSFAYSQAINQVIYKYTVRGVDPQIRKTFDDRTGQLMRDQNFKRSVLERYRVADLPVARAPAAGPASYAVRTPSPIRAGPG